MAAGSGTRFGSPKQFALLAGRPVAAWAVDACRRAADGVVVVVPPGATADALGADVVVEGGATRSASVRRGLAAVPGDAAVVIVHDAARPLASDELFGAVLGALADPEVAGALCAVPVVDTIKRLGPAATAGSLGDVVATVDRAELVAVQTPQAFRADVLRRAHRHGAEATDDASLVEAMGATVRVVPGDPRNIKLTAPVDLAYAQLLLAR